MKVNVAVVKEIEGDFYVSYFKHKNKKTDKSAIYFAKNEKQVYNEEKEAHGEPVIVEKITKKNMSKFENSYDSKDTMLGRLKLSLSSPEKVEFPILIAIYE